MAQLGFPCVRADLFCCSVRSSIPLFSTSIFFNFAIVSDIPEIFIGTLTFLKLSHTDHRPCHAFLSALATQLCLLAHGCIPVCRGFIPNPKKDTHIPQPPQTLPGPPQPAQPLSLPSQCQPSPAHRLSAHLPLVCRGQKCPALGPWPRTLCEPEKKFEFSPVW